MEKIKDPRHAAEYMRSALGAEVPLQGLVHLQPKVDFGVERLPRLGAARVVHPDVPADLQHHPAARDLSLGDPSREVHSCKQRTEGFDPLPPRQRWISQEQRLRRRLPAGEVDHRRRVVVGL